MLKTQILTFYGNCIIFYVTATFHSFQEFCRVFAEVCFFPRLQQFIINQEWNDPKSKLQQCCLTLRTINGQDPDIPVYKVIEAKGPTNTRVYTVAVYFRGDRLAKAEGHSIQQAEMAAAKLALDECGHLVINFNSLMFSIIDFTFF